MSLIVGCSKCGKKYKVGDDKAGKKIKCGGCGAMDVWDLPPAEDTSAPPLPPRAGIRKPAAKDSGKPRKKSGGGSGGVWIVLLVVGGVFMLGCCGVGAALFIPAFQQARMAASRTGSKNNLKQIGMALHQYHESYNMFPPGFTADSTGRKHHSWRVLLLPFLGKEETDLFNQMNFNVPWDDPQNQRFLNRRPDVYANDDIDPNDKTSTAYAGVFGPQSAFSGKKLNFRDFRDGTANTIMAGEAVKAKIPWMKPDDVDITVHGQFGDPLGFTSNNPNGFQALLGDGTVRFVTKDVPQATLNGAYTINGGETVGDF